MTIAYWCLFGAFIMPYLFTVLAKAGNPHFSNSSPRDTLENSIGYRRRANFVQANSFESLPFFAAAVIIAHSHTPQASIDMWAMIYVGARLLYGICYLMDKPTLRSLVWSVGFASCIILIKP